ncbi:MAG: hypothetical protein FJX77_00805 [Armatimonadetes bacterium]|nr:hypothetical protein [Armatimonadota bacterium]
MPSHWVLSRFASVLLGAGLLSWAAAPPAVHAQDRAAFPLFFEGPIEPGIADEGVATIALFNRSGTASFQFTNDAGSTFTVRGAGIRRGNTFAGSLFRLGSARVVGSYSGVLVGNEVTGRAAIRRVGLSDFQGDEVRVPTDQVANLTGTWAGAPGGYGSFQLTITDRPNRFALTGTDLRGRYTIQGLWAPVKLEELPAAAGVDAIPEAFLALIPSAFKMPRSIEPLLIPGQVNLRFGFLAPGEKSLNLNLGRDRTSGGTVRLMLTRQ